MKDESSLWACLPGLQALDFMDHPNGAMKVEWRIHWAASGRRPAHSSEWRPSKLLTLATAFTSAVTFLVPHLPFASLLGFGLMPAHLYLVILLIVIAYMAAAEITKRVSYRVAREAAPPKGQPQITEQKTVTFSQASVRSLLDRG